MAVLERDGFAPIRIAWSEHAHGMGAAMTARLPDRTLEGLFLGIDQTGALLLETATGTLALPAADVYFDGQGKGESHASGN